MRRTVNGLTRLFFIAALTVALQAQDQPAARESVLDRQVHLEKEWVLEIPQVPRWCDRLNLKKSRVNIGDCELYCEEEGMGPPLVLVNGGPGNTHHYFHPEFSRATNFCRVIYYDQRGCGRSDYQPGAGYSTAQAVDDLEKLRVALKIERWIVIGHSYGGWIAQHYAVKYPNHLAGLVLIGAQTVASSHNPNWWDSVAPEEKQAIGAARRDAKLTPGQRVYNAFLCGEWKCQNWFYRPSNEDVARFIRYDDEFDPQFRKTLQIHTPDSKDYFKQCSIPTLILEGKFDKTFSRTRPVEMQAAFPKAQVVVFDKAAHYPFSDAPELLFGELKKFVRQVAVFEFCKPH